MSRRRSMFADQSGFTIIEVMVAMVILLGGLVGALELLNQASATTSSNKAREGAVALQRELVEAARSIPYDQLTSSSLVATLRSKPSFSSSTITADGWTIERRGIDYTMSVGVCAVDDPADGSGALDSTFCASPTPATTSSGCAQALGASGDISGTGAPTAAQIGDCGLDVNKDGLTDKLTAGQTGGCTSSSCGSGTDKTPEDYKRIITLVRWKRGLGTRYALQSSTLPYPGLSGAPRVLALNLVSPSTSPPITITNPAVTSLGFQATTNRAAAAVASTINGNGAGAASDLGGGTLWSFTWNLGSVSPASATQPAAGEVVDGPYEVGAKAYDSFSQAGPVRALSVTLNRRQPFMPTAFKALNVDGVVDIQWTPALERDIDGYRVFRQLGSGTPVTVCALSKATICHDDPPPATGVWTYYAYAYDRDSSNVERPGEVSALVSIDLANKAPNAPATFSGTRDPSTHNVTLNWTASPGDPDVGDSIVGYRVYRDGEDVNDLYSGTLTALTFADTAAGVVERTYYLAAVDSHGAESARLAVTLP